jgi:hypothetical protein
LSAEYKVQDFLVAFIKWVSDERQIRTVMLVGSYARDAATADSDIDLVIVAASPEIYVRNRAWTQLFGNVERQQAEDYGKITSLRVWHSGGPEVEFGFTDATWLASPLDKGTRKVLSDGMQVLFRRDDAN